MLNHRLIYPFHFPMKGKTAKNLFEFLEILEELSESEFRHFVDQEKNDFARWIYACTENKKLSDQIKKIESLHELKDYIKELIVHNLDKIIDAEHIFIEPHKHIVVRKKGEKFEVEIDNETYLIDHISHDFLKKISYKSVKHAKGEIMNHFRVLEEEATYHLIDALKFLVKNGIVKLRTK